METLERDTYDHVMKEVKRNVLSKNDIDDEISVVKLKYTLILQKAEESQNCWETDFAQFR